MESLQAWKDAIDCAHLYDADMVCGFTGRLRGESIDASIPRYVEVFGISELRLAGYQGCIDIEGRHDPVYRGDLEMPGQVHGLNYLKRCRGGAFVPNPV